MERLLRSLPNWIGPRCRKVLCPRLAFALRTQTWALGAILASKPLAWKPNSTKMPFPNPNQRGTDVASSVNLWLSMSQGSTRQSLLTLAP